MQDTRPIFSLRKEGRLEEAYNLSIETYKEAPHEEWVKRAYGWVLYDLLKRALDTGSPEEIDRYLSEIRELHIGEEDEILFNSHQWLIERARPHSRELKKARNLEDEGNYAEALEVFRSVQTHFPDDAHFSESFGWCIYKCIKELSEKGAAQISTYQNLFQEYLPLDTPRPSILHSNMLRLALKFAPNPSFDFGAFFQKWGFQNFQEEDYQKNHWEGKDYPGLAEKAVQHLAKSLMNQGHPEEIEAFLPALEKAIEKLEDNIWLPYYKAKFLIRLGRPDEAEEYLIPVVKRKRTEYWAWAALGDIFKVTNLEKAISCYCKALLCPADEKFLIKTRASFGKLLHRAGMDAEAKTEITKSIRARRELGYNIPQSLQLLEQEDWFRNAEPGEDNTSFYRSNVRLAEEILFAELPWIKANIGRSFTTNTPPQKKMARLFLEVNGQLVETTVKDNAFRISKRFREGQAVNLKAEKTNDRWQVYLIMPREKADLWDLFPEYYGVVDHVNPEKKVAHWIVNRHINGIITFHAVDFSLEEGQFIALRVSKRTRQEKLYWDVLSCLPSATAPSPEVYKEVHGKLDISESKAFGFIGDVFLGPGFIQKNNLQHLHGSEISVSAVISWNRKRVAWGWRGLSLLDAL